MHREGVIKIVTKNSAVDVGEQLNAKHEALEQQQGYVFDSLEVYN